ncbi:MAG: hypothetical protein ACJ748_05645 [Flavisolibacter sp.]
MKFKIFSFAAVSIAFGFIACNNSGNGTGSTDSSTTSNTATTTATSSNNYAARADSFRVNSEAGNYLNPRTGKPYRLSMDTKSGSVTDESGRPVKRYVDKRTWWVYDATSGDTLGSARMDKGNLMYRGINGEWQPYDKRWTDDMDSSMGTNSMNGSSSMSDSNGTGNASGTQGKSKVKVKTSSGKMKSTDKGGK